MNWHVIMCEAMAGFQGRRRVFAEFASVERIGGEGYQAFCPTRRVLSRPQRHTKKRTPVIVPRWEGYCFARLDERAFERRRLHAWPEVYDVIRGGEGNPYVVPDSVIRLIRQVNDWADKHDVTGDPFEAVYQALKVGDKVEVRAAAFAGWIGPLTAIDRDDAVVLLDMLGGPRPIKVPLRELVPAEEAVA